MALDEALFEAVAAGKSPPVLRLYRWQPATITLGYAQREEGAVNYQVCREYGFDVVRRSTGGRAVFHQHEVTYALMAPLDHPLLGGGILESYRAIALPLQQMLLQLGVEAELVPARRSGASLAAHDICFTAPASYELAVGGQKIAGSAQKRNDRAFLQHGSIPVDMNLVLMARLLGRADGSDLTDLVLQLEEKVGWVNRYLSIPVDLDSVEAIMVEAFRQSFVGDGLVSQPTEAEFRRARQLSEERFCCPL